MSRLHPPRADRDRCMAASGRRRRQSKADWCSYPHSPLLASMISFATCWACESMGTWLEGTVMVFAFIVFANWRSRSGAIIRSLAATTYQVGFVFQAAFVTLAPSAAPLVGPWVAARILRSDPGR